MTGWQEDPTLPWEHDEYEGAGAVAWCVVAWLLLIIIGAVAVLAW